MYQFRLAESQQIKYKMFRGQISACKHCYYEMLCAKIYLLIEHGTRVTCFLSNSAASGDDRALADWNCGSHSAVDTFVLPLLSDKQIFALKPFIVHFPLAHQSWYYQMLAKSMFPKTQTIFCISVKNICPQTKNCQLIHFIGMQFNNTSFQQYKFIIFDV